MNLIEIAKKYPKAYDLFVDYGATKLMSMREYTKSMLTTWNDNVPLNGVTEKLLVEFFDEQKLILLPIYFWYKKGWIFELYNNDVFVEGTKEYASRQQASESGIEKCFEILEKQLEAKE